MRKHDGGVLKGSDTKTRTWRTARCYHPLASQDSCGLLSVTAIRQSNRERKRHQQESSEDYFHHDLILIKFCPQIDHNFGATYPPLINKLSPGNAERHLGNFY
jgi:hypothetical protein